MSERSSLDPDSLLESASTALGADLWDLAPFSASELSEPLELLTGDLSTHARLTPRGRDLTVAYLRRLILVRRQLDAHAASAPGLTEAAVDAPIFVIGPPRSGTTVVHRLAALVPGLRAPEGWEFLYPVPPPATASWETDPRVGWAARELTAPQEISGQIRQIHTYSARMPKECLSAMAFALRSEEFISRYNVPNYLAWLRATDMAPAYRVHRLVLATLQSLQRNRRWVLKSPVHLQNLPTLLATYPDARLVITHRDPLPMLSSVSSLVTAMRSAFSLTVDPVAIGRYHLDLYAGSLQELLGHLDSGLLPADRVVHLRHSEIVANAADEVSRALQQLGVAEIETVATELAAAAAEDRDDSPGLHRHQASEFGLDPAEVRELFADYIARFVEV